MRRALVLASCSVLVLAGGALEGPARAEVADDLSGEIELAVETEPPGATVYLNGRRVGLTPWRGRRPPGAVELELVLDGYEAAWSTHRLQADAAGAPFELTVALEPDAPGSPPEPEPEPEPEGEGESEGEGEGEGEDAEPPVPHPVTAGVTATDAVASTDSPAPLRHGLRIALSEGMVATNAQVLRSSVALDLGWAYAFSELVAVWTETRLTLEDPTTVQLRAGARVYLGPAFAAPTVALMVAPSVQLGLGLGLGADVPLGERFFLPLSATYLAWVTGGVAHGLEASVGFGVRL